MKTTLLITLSLIAQLSTFALAGNEQIIRLLEKDVEKSLRNQTVVNKVKQITGCDFEYKESERVVSGTKTAKVSARGASLYKSLSKAYDKASKKGFYSTIDCHYDTKKSFFFNLITWKTTGECSKNTYKTVKYSKQEARKNLCEKVFNCEAKALNKIDVQDTLEITDVIYKGIGC
ncbi:hypothetical protein ACRXCV_05735 [Halobacteriovorax sp. GFR7]|uniref:hypothetical protein n=1 Tax=unclassified Halobacteriovorax TaxID=2639665 RepID=UPI003D9908F8